MWSKRKPHALLVGMQTGAATMENSMEVLQKGKDRIYPIFIAASFTIAKVWK